MKRIARFEHPTNARYYKSILAKTCLAICTITTIWGRKNTELGKFIAAILNRKKAQQQFKRIQRQRESVSTM